MRTWTSNPGAPDATPTLTRGFVSKSLVVDLLGARSWRRVSTRARLPGPARRALQSVPGDCATRRGVRRLGHATRHRFYEAERAKKTSAKPAAGCEGRTRPECNSTPCGSKPCSSARRPQHILGRGRWQLQWRLRRHRGRTPKRTARGRPAIGVRRTGCCRRAAGGRTAARARARPLRGVDAHARPARPSSQSVRVRR